MNDISQPVLTNTTGLLLVLKSLTPILIVGRHLSLLSEGACSMLSGVTVILHLKNNKRYIYMY